MATKNSASGSEPPPSVTEEVYEYPDYLAGYETDLTQRLIIPGDIAFIVDKCLCPNPKTAVVDTDWGAPNRGRRLLRCAKAKGKRCNFHKWLDRAFSPRATVVIDHMYKTLEQLLFELNVSKSLLTGVEAEFENMTFISTRGRDNEGSSSNQGGAAGLDFDSLF